MQWARTTFAERRKVLKTMLAFVLANQETIARVACLDSGKTMVDAALGEILACSSETLVDGKRLGVEDVRFAVLKAVGLEGEERKGFTESKKKKKKGVEMQP